MHRVGCIALRSRGSGAAAGLARRKFSAQSAASFADRPVSEVNSRNSSSSSNRQGIRVSDISVSGKSEVKIVHVGKRGFSSFIAIGSVAVGVVGVATVYMQMQLNKQAELEEIRLKQLEQQRLEQQQAEREAQLKAMEQAALLQRQAALFQRQAQAARDCEPALAALQTHLRAAEGPAVSSSLVDDLEIALKNAETVVRSAPLSDDVREAASLAFHSAAARLSVMHRILQVRSDYEQAKVSLGEAVASRNSAQCREKLQQLENVQAALATLCGDALPDSHLADHAREQLLEFERIEREAARRLHAVGLLEAAVASLRPDQCTLALAQAEEVGLEPTREHEIASLRVQPPMHADMVQDVSSRVATLSYCSSDLSVNDFVDAETELASTMDSDALRFRAGQLSKSLVEIHLLLSERLKAELSVADADFVSLCMQRELRTVEAFKAKLDAVAVVREAKWKDYLAEHSRQLVAEAISAIQVQADQAWDGMNSEAQLKSDIDVAMERKTIQKNLTELADTVETLASIDREPCDPHLKASVVRSLSKSLLNDSVDVEVRGVLKQHGRKSLDSGPVDASDDFATRLLALVPQHIAKKATLEPPRVSEVASAFNQELRSLVRAAFTPASNGLLSSILAAGVGFCFGQLYVLRGISDGNAYPSPPLGGRFSEATAGEEEQLRRNLMALAKAADLVERAQFERAFLEIEAELSGLCCVRALPWLKETRDVLLAHRVTQVLKARASCLTMDLQ